MRYLAVIPARGGSKGIPKKNIAPLCGKPLLSYTLEWITRVKEIESQMQIDVVVSTDSEEIACVTKKFMGIEVVMRPKEISGDTASTEAALFHAIEKMQTEKKVVYDAVLTLQPTSPFRKEQTFIEFIHQFERDIKQFDALLSLHETRTDYWVQKQDGFYGRLHPDAPRRRQEREPMYIENSAYYVTKTDALYLAKSVLGTKVNGFLIDETEGLDINTPIDLAIAEAMMEEV